MEKRATTQEQKKQVIDKIYYTWLQFPDLRIGQLLEVVKDKRHTDLFYIEDFDLSNDLEKFSKENGTF